MQAIRHGALSYLRCFIHFLYSNNNNTLDFISFQAFVVPVKYKFNTSSLRYEAQTSYDKRVHLLQITYTSNTHVLQQNQETVMLPCLDRASLSFQCADKITRPTCIEAMLNIGGNQIDCGRWIKGGRKGESQGAKPQGHTHSAQQIILFVRRFLTSLSPESGWLSLTHTGPHIAFTGVGSQRELQLLSTLSLSFW